MTKVTQLPSVPNLTPDVSPHIFPKWHHQIREQLNLAETAIPPQIKGDSTDSIQYYLNCISWSGGDRRFFEALPYLESVEDINSLRMVLFRLGFTSSAEQVSQFNLRNEFLPCFVLNEQKRLLVLKNVDAEGMCTVFDPEHKQTTSLPIQAIQGMAVFPEKNNNPEKTVPKSNEKWTSLAIKAFSTDLRLNFLMSFAINMFMLAMPIYVMSVYDKATATKSMEVLIGLSVGILLITLADRGLKIIKSNVHAYLGARLDAQSSEAVFQKLLYFPLQMIESAPIGSQITRLRQMNGFRDAFTGILVSTLFDMPFLVLFLLTIALVGGPLVFVPLALIVLYAVMALWAIPKNKALTQDVSEAKTDLQNISMEMISGQEQIRNLSSQRVWIEKYRKLSAKAAASNVKLRQYTLLCQVVAQGLVTVSGIATLTIGTLMVINGSLSGGALIASMALAWRVLGPIRSMFMVSMTIGQTMQSFDQINRLMNIKTERTPEKAPSISHTYSGNIKFDRIGFRYAGRQEPALRQISFDVKKGELVAICGASGAGKSTLLKILLGFYPQQAGSVLIDGIDLRQLDIGEWRQSIGVALEASDFFYGTIAQNIRLAHPTATDAEIIDITTRFGIDKYFGSILKEGLETRMTSTSLAAWPDALQKRLSLCRAFIRDNPVCILDNPVDNLDTPGEEALIAMLQERRGTTTTLMSTHRPSQMRLADKVLWVNDGAVVGFDSPDAILPAFLESIAKKPHAA